MFLCVHGDAGSKVMSNVRLVLDWAGRKFSFFSQFFFVLCGQERVKTDKSKRMFLAGAKTPTGQTAP